MGELRGEPFRLTGDQWDFLLRFYALDDSGRFVHRRGGMLVRPVKQGKGPLSAAVVAAEALGPTLFAGWDPEGEPVGRTHPSPWIQVAAVSEDQAMNIWRALLAMLQLGGIAHEVDVGLTRVNLESGGRVEFVTAAHRSRAGQRVTFAALDEVGLWLPGNHGPALLDAISRNLAGMGGRFMATTNAWDPAEDSVAQRVGEHPDGVFVDDVEPGTGSVRNRQERRRVLRKVYGDAATGCEAQGNASGRIPGWIDLDRLELELDHLLARGDAAQAERYYLNRKIAAESRAFDLERWQAQARPDHQLVPTRQRVKLLDGRSGWYDPDVRLAIGVDGALFRDAIAAIATEVDTGWQFVVSIIERPEDAGDDYQHDLDQVDGEVSELVERHSVERIYDRPPVRGRARGSVGEPLGQAGDPVAHQPHRRHGARGADLSGGDRCGRGDP